MPRSGAILRAPVAFLNGSLNLIASLEINSNTINQAHILAVGGDLLRKHPEDLETPAELWIALGNPSRETNEALAFDRAAARGMRLNIAAGTAVRFEPGQTRTVELVDYAGERKVYGFQGKVMVS